VQIHVYRFDGINYHPYGRQYHREIALGYVTYEGQGNMIGRQIGEHYCEHRKQNTIEWWVEKGIYQYIRFFHGALKL